MLDWLMRLWIYLFGEPPAPADTADEIIGDPPYMYRWFAWPKNRFCNLFLHMMVRDDDDRALHDHPYWSLSLILAGGYYDIRPGPDGTEQRIWYPPGSIIWRWASSAHRLELRRVWAVWRGDAEATRAPAMTLFLTGPTIRRWGFHCPTGWKDHDDFAHNGGC